MKPARWTENLLDLTAETAGYALALAGFAFVIMFFWIALATAPALSKDNEACGGTDLIAHYRETSPEKLSKIEVEAAETLNGEGVFWKISKDGVPDSWLLGTMHMADERIARLEGVRLDAFEASKRVVVENVEALDPKTAQQTLAGLPHLMLAEPGKTLDQLLDEQSLDRLKPAIEARGIPYPVALKLRPWLIATTVSIPACEAMAKKAGKPVLDGLLVEKANEAGKPVSGLETMEEQLSAIAGLPMDFHVTALRETLEIGPMAEDIVETMKQLYLTEKIGMVLPLMAVASPKTDNAGANSRFQERLIADRNVLMADRSKALLAEGGAFIAVGALHLPGETGLVAGFRNQGYTVTRVK